MKSVASQSSLSCVSRKPSAARRVSARASSRFCALLCGALLAAGSAGAQLVISSFDSAGMLAWSNSLPNASLFSVQWSGPLSNPAWHSGWDGLADIPATNGASYRVQVPMAYRLVAQTNVLRSRWTLLFYMMADNNLESDFITKFAGMARWNGDTNVQIVVQFARNGLDTRYGNWQGCERFVITNGMVPSQENAVPDWGDGSGGRRVNMSDPATLAAFLDWAMVRYPAERHALFVGDHGFGWKGFGVCDSYADSFIATENKHDAVPRGLPRMVRRSHCCWLAMALPLHARANRLTRLASTVSDHATEAHKENEERLLTSLPPFASVLTRLIFSTA